MKFKIEIQISITPIEPAVEMTDAWVEHCRRIGGKGGASTSDAKRQAARANARKPRPAARQRNAEKRAERARKGEGGVKKS